jgi:hypothetical protein
MDIQAQRNAKARLLFKPFTQNTISRIKELRENETVRLDAEEAIDELEEEEKTKKRGGLDVFKQRIFKTKKKRKLQNNINPSKEFLTGNSLQNNLKNSFPPELIGKPIEEIDEFYKYEYVSQLFFKIFVAIKK